MSRLLAAPGARRIVGDFCEREIESRRTFAPGSFRWIKSGRGWVLVGCPRGRWNDRTERCSVGTRAHKVLAPAPTGRCPIGKRIHK